VTDLHQTHACRTAFFFVKKCIELTGHRGTGGRHLHISAKQRTMAKIELISNGIETREREDTSLDNLGPSPLVSATIVIE
jgi:hypothetical protein